MAHFKKPIIAFTGLAQSGKTTAANAFIAIGFDRMSFAEPIKAMVSCLTPCKDKDARPPSLCGKTLREVYQTLGTDWGRKMVGEDIWILAGRARLDELLGDVESDIIRGIVLDDVRFDNEAELIRNMGGLVVEITRSSVPQMEHSSEAGIARELIDYSFANEGDILTLQHQVRDYLLVR